MNGENRTYRRNVARELINAVIDLELQRDRLVIALLDMVKITEGKVSARKRAIKLLHNITGEIIDGKHNAN